MRPHIWDRGDLCEYDGDLYIVLTPPSRTPVVIEAIEGGHRHELALRRGESTSPLLRRPRKSKLAATKARLERLASSVASRLAHIGIELDRRR
jgi:hypothetical protein